jgi:dolichol-phosphate mannosyltransferase
MVKKSNKVELTIVIPVKNEEENIINTLQAIHRSVKFPHKVIIIDGRSTDQTVNLVKNFIKKHENVKIIVTSPEKSAFKESLEVGIKAANTEFIATFMGDLSDDPNTLNKMYKKAQTSYDVVIASRYIPKGGTINKPLLQALVSWTVSKTLHYVTGIPIHDVSNPFTLYRRNLITNINTVSIANELPIELVYKAYFKGAKITEVPTVWRGRKTGKSKFNIYKVIPGYAKIYIWVLINSWKFKLGRIIP